jgi:choline dehydrogenase
MQATEIEGAMSAEASAETYDVVIVGAGSAGAALAGRLSDDPSRSVALIEAGPDYPEVSDLPEGIRHGRASATLKLDLGIHDWDFVGRATEARPEMSVTRGRVTGGSSAVNGQIWLRGMPEDYAWGDELWTWEHVLRSFQASEDDPGLDEEIHGRGGPIRVRRYARENWVACARSFAEACRALGYNELSDLNDPDGNGFGAYTMNNPDEIRLSTAIAYLGPARGRPNLTIFADTLARRVLFNGNRAAGVEVEDASGAVSVISGNEVVLSAGAVGSPHLLMLSGVGPRDQLEPLGIPIVSDLPGVGKNLQDHPIVYMAWQVAEGNALTLEDPIVQVALRYTARGSHERNDMWLTPCTIADLFLIVPGVYLPYSRGELSLVSADVHVQPRLDYRYLTDARDRERLLEGIRIALRITEQAQFRDLLATRLAPTDEDLDSDEVLEAWLERSVETSHHISCTCSMGGPDEPLAVVDGEGRVRGVERLRVVDASIMPVIPRANTNASTIMLAERIAALASR